MTQRSWFLAGLFLTTVAALVLEILDTRLLSVLTWYHLSFFAVSIAMFGMAAGGVRVYLGEDDFAEAVAPAQLARYSLLFALAVPLCHVVNLAIPVPIATSATSAVGILLATLALALPFYLGGIVVAIALTRVPGPSGLIYAVDLLGAALGALLVVPLLAASSISSAALACGAIAALGSFCFARFAGLGRAASRVALAAVLVLVAFANMQTLRGFHVAFSKGAFRDQLSVESQFWTIHGEVVTAFEKTNQRPFYWGAGEGSGTERVNRRKMVIDGAAATFMTEWDGDPSSLEWVRYDVTSLPYHIRKGGDVAVIGVGGGRDILTALWGGAESVTGIEINSAFIQLLEDEYRDYAKIADQPHVSLVHDEARSYLTRSDEKFDVLQMSLIDTWAATGAGAFTLSENGLYTLESWRTFLNVLKPRGIFSVSRWYSSYTSSETSRLVSLATAALLDRGITRPELHMILVARERVATLLISKQPFSRDDFIALEKVAGDLQLTLLLAPRYTSPDPLLAKIASSASIEQLHERVADEPYDYSVPTDERPYFFNILKPSRVFAGEYMTSGWGVIAWGNVLATATLLVLWAITFLLVMGTIFYPLARSGLPDMEASSFTASAAYFGLIGMGYMLVQIPLMQRFSVYLGHPTYTVAGVLFSMILATGLGSLVSDRIPFESESRWMKSIPIAIAALLASATFALQSIMDATIQAGLGMRFAVTVLVVGIVAFPLGFCFPMGLRLVRRISDDATPWMWGINGAAGVLASVSAVGISMWSGISTSIYLATAAYLALMLPATALWRRGAAGGS